MDKSSKSKSYKLLEPYLIKFLSILIFIAFIPVLSVLIILYLTASICAITVKVVEYISLKVISWMKD